MKTIAFICQKGGTAKTTGAINLAVEALAYGLKVVLIDLDPQVSASNWFDLREDPEPAIVAPQVPHLGRVLEQAAARKGRKSAEGAPKMEMEDVLVLA